MQSSQPTTQAFIRTRIKAFARLQKVHGAVHAQRASVEHVRVDHGCFHILMAPRSPARPGQQARIR